MKKGHWQASESFEFHDSYLLSGTDGIFLETSVLKECIRVTAVISNISCCDTSKVKCDSLLGIFSNVN